MKEQVIHGHTDKNREELTAALSAFADLFNREWRLVKVRFRSPLETRRDHQTSLRVAA